MNPNLKWFMVSTKAKLEMKAKESIEKAITKDKKENLFGQILVPQIEETVVVKGQKKTKKVARYPNYILVQLDPTNEALNLVKKAQHVNGFVGDGQKPKPLSDSEIKGILDVVNNTATKTTPSMTFHEGEDVKIINGPFKDFEGVVGTIKPEKLKLTVLVTVFGRSTPVELGYEEVVKNKK